MSMNEYRLQQVRKMKTAKIHKKYEMNDFKGKEFLKDVRLCRE